MKVIALLPVKNEAWVLRHCLSSLTFCDEILAIDDGSTDTTRSILEEYACTILPFQTDAKIGWSEFAIRTHLLLAARERGATHIVALDGDEMFSNLFIKDARSIFSSLQQGETLSLPWIDVVDQNAILTNFVKKVFAFADDGTSEFKPGFIHIPRVPDTNKSKSIDLPYAVLHFQHLNKIRHDYKKIWYMMSEYEKGIRSAWRINTTYHSINYQTIPFAVNTLISVTLPNPAEDSGLWQREKVITILNRKKSLFFEPLDIWYQPDLFDIFYNENHRAPKPQQSSWFIKSINRYKNKVINYLREWRT
jgi:glycosyltransferase involved in cell wall biosynthesis